VSNNVSTAPDGTTTADKIIPSTSDVIHIIYPANSISSITGTYTVSIFAKADGYNFIYFGLDGASGDGLFPGSAGFSLLDGSYQLGDNTVSASSQQLGNGWYRLSVTGASSSTVTASPYVCPATGKAFGNVYFAGNGTSGVLVWGMQFEAGSFPTSYIPTVASTVTRAADVASITGTNFSSWYRQDEGTLLASAIPFGPSAANFVADMDEGAVVNEIGLAVSSTFFWGLVYNSGSYQADLRHGTPVAKSKFLASLAYKANNFQLSANGVAYSPDTSGSVPAMARMTIGHRTNTANWLNGTIARLAYYPVRLPDAQLQELTK
jgi:hypothetical protein